MTSKTLRLWRNNRLDQEWTATLDELANWYMDSDWPDEPMFIERKLRGFLTTDERVASVWDDEETFTELVELVTERESAHRSTDNSQA